VLVLQRRELANRKPAAGAVAILADPVFGPEDIRVAKAKGNGNQHRKDTAENGSKTRPETSSPLAKGIAPGPPAAPTTSAASPAKTPVSPAPPSASSTSSAATNGNSALVSALRDIGADPNGKMGRLPYSREEARSIARAVPANQSFTALDFAASRETAISSKLSNYRIIHFATHGVMDLEHPELSGIVLSMVNEKGDAQNGYLRLHEIYNLNLPAELVVLSACETGVGKQIKGEGLIALTRGFMYAGSRSVVASLWKVDDSATAALMAEFYQQMFTHHLKPAAALRAAQRKIAAQKLWQSPYYWAGFFLQGEWN
jgi:CHAT domain-containing protein